MNHKRKVSLLALLLAAALALSAPAFSARADALDLEQSVSFTVNAGPADYFDDLVAAGVTVDLYKIADAVPEPKADSDGNPLQTHGSMYVFAMTDEAAALGLDLPIGSYDELAALDIDGWDTLAQTSAAAVLAEGVTYTGKTSLLVSESTPQPSADVASGLYLVIPHGTDLTELEDYVFTDEEGVITTAVTTAQWIYSYKPQLVALPSTVDEMNEENQGTVSTAGGDWQYDITATLKPEQKPRMGDLIINKIVQVYETSSPVTFGYRVVATLNGETVFDDEASITYPRESSTEIIGRIPVGATVVVTETYTGAGYKVVGSAQSDPVTILPPAAEDEEEAEVAQVTFTNTYDNKIIKGYGILNTFEFDEETGWHWYKDGVLQEDPVDIGPTVK